MSLTMWSSLNPDQTGNDFNTTKLSLLPQTSQLLTDGQWSSASYICNPALSSQPPHKNLFDKAVISLPQEVRVGRRESELAAGVFPSIRSRSVPVLCSQFAKCINHFICCPSSPWFEVLRLSFRDFASVCGLDMKKAIPAIPLHKSNKQRIASLSARQTIWDVSLWFLLLFFSYGVSSLEGTLTLVCIWLCSCRNRH